MRMRWLAISGALLLVAALALHTVGPRLWPVAFFGSAMPAPAMMGPAMMPGAMMAQGGMMAQGDMGAMMGQGGMGAMMSGELLGDPAQPFDLRWLDTMILHHEGGVRMTEHMAAQSSRPELRDLAGRIIAAQQREVDQMRAWRAAWYPDAPALVGLGPMSGQGMMPAGEMRRMMGSANLDQMFLQMMIPHHEAAIGMAGQSLSQAAHPELKTLAVAISTAQRAEIDEMQGYLRDWYGTTP
jgi:uncharacterized protein (DUF305 family)